MEINFKELDNKSGVYLIRNTISKSFYIGSSKNLYDRLHLHFHRLKKQKHSSKHLQASYNKYGTNVFEYEILEFCLPEIRLEREQFYINLLKPNFNKSYNVKGCLGIPLSEKRKKIISETLKKKYKNKEICTYKQSHKWFKIYVYNIYSLELYKEYDYYYLFIQDIKCGKYTYSYASSHIIKEKFIILTELISNKEILFNILQNRYLINSFLKNKYKNLISLPS